LRGDVVQRVLLIEDHDASRRGFAEYLTAEGYAVLEAPTGSAGLTAASTWQPDVIVLDLGLPDVDGWSVAREIKAAPATTHVPIIALTGADLPHERASAMRAGCDFHLAKPCFPAELLDAIRRLTEGRLERRT
jgi:two-component system cell cycle response regulator DivK